MYNGNLVAMSLPGAPAFDEDESVRAVRQMAQRLGASRLLLFVTGATGTGRRTLARALAEQRAGERLEVLEVQPGELGARADGRVLVVAHPELLAATEQVSLAFRIKSGQRVVMWGDASFLDVAMPELRVHAQSGVLRLPPLRDRGLDVAKWADYFLRDSSPSAPLSLSALARTAITSYDWPGNLTELRSSITRAVALPELPGSREVSPADLGIEASAQALEPAIESLSTAVDRFRTDYVRRALAACDGNRTRAARLLGIDPRTIFRHLERKTAATEDDD